MNRSQRLLQHLGFPRHLLRQRFGPAELDTLTRLIADGEQQHLGELRLALEARLSVAALWHGQSSRQRAEELFAHLGVWDTEANTGVLIYVLLAERRIEIIADRGIHQRVGEQGWQAICELMRVQFLQQQWQLGLEQGIAAVHQQLIRHFPSAGHPNPDELPDRPVLL